MTDFPILSALIGVPAAGAVVVALLPRRRTDAVRLVGLLFTFATAGLAGWLVWHFVAGPIEINHYQFVEEHAWFGDLGVRYLLGVDGISLFMVLLTALLFPLSLLISTTIDVNVKGFTAWMLLLEAALIGVFLALDLILFFFFFELVLAPMFVLIGQWGHGRRVYSALKFFVFTMAGSAFLFAGILTVAFLHQGDTGVLTFDVRTITSWAPAALSVGTARWLFVAFTVGFAVKVPLFPVHTWLPDAHTDAPTAGSVILAGVLLKMGTYGFLRFSIAIFPEAAVWAAPALLAIAVVGILYGAVVAAMQPDLKRVVAYSSVAHLGFATLGIFALTTEGLEGGVFTMISHGLTTGALFILVGYLFDRRHTHLISEFGGLWRIAPVLGGLWVVAVFASIGLPGFSGFIGEFLALIGTFTVHRPFAAAATFGTIFAALYLLWAFQRTFTGMPRSELRGHFPDVSVRELVAVVPLLALSLFLGVYPRLVLDRVEPAVKALVDHVERHSDFREPERRVVPAVTGSDRPAETSGHGEDKP